MDQKTSLLVQGQVPEFVREDYPKFISFIKAYYEFLENEQIVDGVSEKNNLTEILKRLRYIGDIDSSLDLFEDQFYNTFLPLLPKDTVVDKAFLVKNVLPLYQSKGSSESFQYLFRLLFGQEIEIEKPRDRILRASDGKWVVENILRTTTVIYSQYVGDGSTTTYYLPYVISSENVEIFLNGQLQEEITNYTFKKELKKITFNTPPSASSTIKILYKGNFDTSIFHNRQIIGQTSGATTIVEKVSRRNIGGLNLLQFFINSKNITSNFTNGEVIRIDVIDGNQVLNFYLECFSEIESLNIVEPGSGYLVGDKILFKGPSTVQPIAVVSKISTGNLESIRVTVGSFGSGYKVGNNVWANNVTTNNFLSFIDLVDTTGFSSPNTLYYVEDLISDYTSIVVSDETTGEIGNTNTIISEALNNIIVTGLGPALNVIVASTDLKPNALPTFEANSTIITGTTRVQDVGAIGTIKVDVPGYGYRIGDTITFTNDYYYSGQGANAYVSAVSPVTGGIKKVSVRKGGSHYRLDYPPILTINSVSGVGGKVSVKDLMGQGAQFEYDPGDGIQGKILEISLLERGTGFLSTPIIDMRYSGDGLAQITAQTRTSLVSLPGRWITSDSMLSTDETKLQGGDYYIDFSYVVASQVEFSRYKEIVKNLLNPSGAVNYARYVIDENVDTGINLSVASKFEKQLVGTANISANGILVIGTGTYFELANTLGILHTGSYIKVNSELRVVNSIINNTYLTVSENFLNARSYEDQVGDYLNVYIDSVDYGFPRPGVEDMDTVIYLAFSNTSCVTSNMIISTMNDYDSLLSENWAEVRIEGTPPIYITTEGVE